MEKKIPTGQPKQVRIHDMKDYAHEVGAHGAQMYMPKDKPVTAPIPKAIKK